MGRSHTPESPAAGILIDRKGKVAAGIVGVGGSLGMGEKDVALTFDQFSFATDNKDPLIVETNATKESLQAALQYTRPDSRTVTRAMESVNQSPCKTLELSVREEQNGEKR